MNSPCYLIACEVMRPEIERLLADMECPFHISWMKQGLHNSPDILRREVQRQIHEYEQAGATDILLGYGLCGRGLSGVTGEKATLVLPKVHDCVPLLLGVDQVEANRLSEGGCTLWMSPGWNRYELGPRLESEERRYEEYGELYGQEGAEYIKDMELSFFKNYVKACLIRWEDYWNDMQSLVRQSRAIAASKGLPYRECSGVSDFLCALLSGGRTASFFHLEPGASVDIDANGNLIITSVSA